MIQAEFTAEGLIAAAQAGDRVAFKELYLGSVEAVLSYARRRLPFHEAEDLTAEVFSVAWRKLPDYQFVGIPLDAWLLTIAKNQLRSQARRAALIEMQVTTSEEMPTGSSNGAEVEALKALTVESLRRALQRLAPGHSLVLRLRFLEELTVAECALELDCSEESVRVKTFRALQKLRVLTKGETL